MVPQPLDPMVALLHFQVGLIQSSYDLMHLADMILAYSSSVMTMLLFVTHQIMDIYLPLSIRIAHLIFRLRIMQRLPFYLVIAELERRVMPQLLALLVKAAFL